MLMMFNRHAQKGFKRGFSLLCSLFLFFCGSLFVFSDQVSAYELGGRGKVWINGGYIDQSFISTSSGGDGVHFINDSNSSGWVKRFCANFSSTLPGDTIVNISIRFALTDAGSIGSITPDQYWGVIGSSVSNYDRISVQTWQLWNSNGGVQSICFQADNLYWSGYGSRVDVSGGDYYYVVEGATHDDMNQIYNLLDAQKNNVVDIANTSLQTYSLLNAQKNNVVDIANASISIDGKINSLITSSNSVVSNTQTAAQQTTQINDHIQQENQNISDQTTSDIQGVTDATTESLLSTLVGFGGVVSSINPSDCRINANLGHFSLGTLDLCQDSPPSFITIIGSLVLCFMLVGFCYAMLQKILSLVREMQT